jgi:hypothetical protein
MENKKKPEYLYGLLPPILKIAAIQYHKITSQNNHPKCNENYFENKKIMKKALLDYRKKNPK